MVFELVYVLLYWLLPVYIFLILEGRGRHIIALQSFAMFVVHKNIIFFFLIFAFVPLKIYSECWFLFLDFVFISLMWVFTNGIRNKQNIYSNICRPPLLFRKKTDKFKLWECPNRMVTRIKSEFHSYQREHSSTQSIALNLQ